MCLFVGVDLTEPVNFILSTDPLHSLNLRRFSAVSFEGTVVPEHGCEKKESPTWYRYLLSATEFSSTSVYDCSCELFFKSDHLSGDKKDAYKVGSRAR